MNTVAVRLPEALYRRAEAQATGRGASVETLVQELLEGYLEELEASPSQTLAEALAEARAQIEAEGTPLIHSWEELEAEIGERRGASENWRVELVALAEAARAEALANAEQLLDWEALAREVAEHRGGYQGTDE